MQKKSKNNFGNILKIIIENRRIAVLKVLRMQEKKPTKGDWYSTALTDMEEFKLNLTIDELKRLKKEKVKN